MTRFNTTLTAIAAMLLSASALPVWADSSVASSASESVSTSVGSVSTSIKKSSGSSSDDKKVAAGDYQVMAVAVLADAPGMVRLELQALAADGLVNAFTLDLPQQAFDSSRLSLGQVVTARDRAYGTEFVSANTKQAFFLALDDHWLKELPSRAVVL